MAILCNLFAGLPWYELAPEDDHAVVREGYGGGIATVLTARTADGRLSVSYVPSAGLARRALTVALSTFAGPVRGRWYNPADGRAFEVTGSPFENRDTHRFLSPGDNGSGTDDWVLILDVVVEAPSIAGKGVRDSSRKRATLLTFPLTCTDAWWKLGAGAMLRPASPN